MPILVPLGLAQLFGSKTRVRTLAPIANSTTSLSAYRIAQVAEVPRTKIYDELARLEASGWVMKAAGPTGQTLWQITDPDLRRLIRRRMRIYSAGDLVLEAPMRSIIARKAMARSKRRGPPAALFQPEFRPRNAKDYDRPPEKDAILAALGLRPSRRARRRTRGVGTRLVES